jgi:hypothetical protein
VQKRQHHSPAPPLPARSLSHTHVTRCCCCDCSISASVVCVRVARCLSCHLNACHFFRFRKMSNFNVSTRECAHSYTQRQRSLVAATMALRTRSHLLSHVPYSRSVIALPLPPPQSDFLFLLVDFSAVFFCLLTRTPCPPPLGRSAATQRWSWCQARSLWPSPSTTREGSSCSTSVLRTLFDLSFQSSLVRPTHTHTPPPLSLQNAKYASYEMPTAPLATGCTSSPPQESCQRQRARCRRVVSLAVHHPCGVLSTPPLSTCPHHSCCCRHSPVVTRNLC